jgi:uncharacterized membrane protein YphA (DoxX/SURF4 family)
MKKYQDIAALILRLALSATFLSAVASRAGLWGTQSSGWKAFMEYATQVNAFAPVALIPVLAITATILEVLLSLALIIGYQTRLAAIGAAILTLLFAIAMSISFSVKDPLDYSVFVDAAAALLLATMPQYRWSLDELKSL